MRLLARTPVCYKPYMRKWMRERMKRRKKGGEAQPQANAPEPLQPKYFDNELEAPAAPPIESVPQPRSPETETTEAESARGPEPPPQVAEVQPRPARSSRRRRGRGGRSRARQAKSQAVPVAEEQPPAPQESMPPEPLVPPAPSPAPSPASKGTVVLAIGLPGSGKSSWFKRHNIRPLSSDLLRQLLFDDAEEQRFQDLIFSNLRSMLKARLIARRPMNYVDATNLTPHDRQSWIKLAKDYGYDVQGVFFDVPLEICLERNQRRHRTVSEDVMRRMAGKLKAPTFEEGFSKITVVRVKQKE